MRTLTGHTSGVSAVALSPDGKRALSGSLDKTLKLWDLGTGKELRTLTGHTKGVGAVALSADGTRALSGSDDKTLKVWDLLDGNCLATVFLEGDVNVVAVSPNGKTIVAGDEGGNMYFLKLEGIADSEQKLQPTSINDINNTEGWIQRLWQNVKTKLRG